MIDRLVECPFGVFHPTKTHPAAGTDSRLVSTAVQPHCVTRQGTSSTVGFDVNLKPDERNNRSKQSLTLTNALV
jgi:hypothetical protein